jgi:hypothetical protein
LKEVKNTMVIPAALKVAVETALQTKVEHSTLLNHLNLFGAGYLGAVDQILRKYGA